MSASIVAFVRREEGENRLDLLVDGAHCAACIRAIEGGLAADPAVRRARLNLGLRRLSVAFRGEAEHADAIAGMIESLGYRVAPFDPSHLGRLDAEGGRELLRAMAIAGFAATNVMMLSLAVWAGQVEDMTPATQHFLQWAAAIVTVPAVLLAGRPFFRSALRALARGRTNIDVPIALGITLTLLISITELLRQGRDVYFDSAASLLFVLLIGRYLDHRVRARGRMAIERLVMLQAEGATVIDDDGALTALPASRLQPGMRILIRPGERVPVDGLVTHGASDLDTAIVTGESLPRAVTTGDRVLAGCVNGAGSLEVTATASAADSHLADIVRLIEAAEQRRGHLASLSDRVALIWTPIIHGLALATLLVWWLVLDGGLPTALLHAVSVLIIACPCAIGLAVPAVQVVAGGALLRRGILTRGGDVLERLARVDTVVFDKTGTLTDGTLELTDHPDDTEALRLAAAMAAASTHPLARALVAALPPAAPMAVLEVAGRGLEAGPCRLGSAAFCGVETRTAETEVWLSRPGARPVRFRFEDRLRPGAKETVAALRRAGVEIALLSGDRPAAVSRIAAALGIDRAEGGLVPAGKLARLEALRARGKRVLMVGDGVNDAPALAAAHVGASFTRGASVAQGSADLILPETRLSALIEARAISRRALAVIRQNLLLAALYNGALIPVAMAGLVTPLNAAIAMAASSLTVTLNALRAGTR